MSSVKELPSSMGEVREVRTEVQGIYYNVTVSVSRLSHVAKWYMTPGQYLDLLPVKSQHEDSLSFFIASPLFGWVQDDDLFLEFLIADVPGTVAAELIRSQPGDSVVVTINDYSKGFDVEKLYPISSAESVLMFASGYGLGPMRAFIETGFLAKHRKDAILYTLYPHNPEPYVEKHPAWETSGITIIPFENDIKLTDPTKTVVLIVAFRDEQKVLKEYFEKIGVPHDKILTLFDGIPSPGETSKKTPGKPNFLHMGDLCAPFSFKMKLSAAR